MLELYLPSLNDLAFKQKMLADENTMSYNRAFGGTIDFPKEKWEIWYDKWVINHENKRYYRNVKVDDDFVGEVAYHFDIDKKIYLTDVIVFTPYRNKGYGTAALRMLCDVAKSNGIKELYDDIAVDNPSVSMFEKCGFYEVMKTDKYILVKKNLE